MPSPNTKIDFNFPAQHNQMATQEENSKIEKNFPTQSTHQMDLNIIAKNLNDDCLSYIYSFIDRKQLCYDFLTKKREDIIYQGVMKPKLKTFQEGKYYTCFRTNMIGLRVLFIKKITKCFITYDYYGYYYFEPNKFKTEKRKRNIDSEGNEYLKEPHNFNIKDFIELEKLPYCCYVLKEKFRFEEPKSWREYKYDYRESSKVRHWIENKQYYNTFENYEEYNEFDWLLNDLRKKKIKEAQDEIAERITNRESTCWNTNAIVEKSEYIECLKKLLE